MSQLVGVGSRPAGLNSCGSCSLILKLSRVDAAIDMLDANVNDKIDEAPGWFGEYVIDEIVNSDDSIDPTCAIAHSRNVNKNRNIKKLGTIVCGNQWER